MSLPVAQNARSPWRPSPLDSHLAAEAQRVASRLRADWLALLKALPADARSASGLARALRLGRVNCQRLVFALESADGPALLTRLPGVDGLTQLADAISTTFGDLPELAAARTATEHFARLCRAAGGSHARLIARLRLAELADGSAGPAGHTPDASKQRLFDAAAEVTGRSADLSVSIYAFRRIPGRDNMLERALIHGIFGARALPGGMPLVLFVGDTHSDLPAEGTPDPAQYAEQARQREAQALSTPGKSVVLSDFSTQPVPILTDRRTERTHLDLIDAPASRPVDIVTAIRTEHPYLDPQTGLSTLDAVWTLMNTPIRKLVFDVYLHRTLERTVRPAIDAQLWNPGLDLRPENRWVARLPEVPKLQLLGQGIERSASPLSPRHAAMTRQLFERLSWDPSDFFGVRCELTYPVWRAGYCVVLEPAE